MRGSLKRISLLGLPWLAMAAVVVPVIGCGDDGRNEVLSKAKSAMETVDSYRLESEVVTEDDQGEMTARTQVSFRWSRPDTWHRKVTLTELQRSTVNESIRIDGRFFQRGGSGTGGTWTEQDVNPIGSTGGRPSNISPPEALVDPTLAPVDVTESVIDGVEVFVVRHQSRTGGTDPEAPVLDLPLSSIQTVVTTTILVRRSDFRLHGIDRQTERVVLYRPDPDKRASVEQGIAMQQTATNRFFDYERSFDIEPPTN